MSEENKTQPTPPPTPVAKTSAVPLKKETVRITLRARPGAGLTQPKELTTPIPSTTGTTPVPRPITVSVTPAGAATARVPTAPIVIASKATAPIQLPSSPLPPPAARMSTTQVQLPPAPIVPISPSGAPPRPSIAPPRPPGAPPAAPGIPPTVPLAKIPAGAGAGGPPRPPGVGAPKPALGMGAPKPPPGAPRMEPGATTVPLAKSPPGGAPRPGAMTATPGPGGKVGVTQQLPKATVQLAKGTTPLQQPTAAPTPPSAPVKRIVDDTDLEEDKDPEAGLAPLAVVCFVLALGLMLVNMVGTDKVVGRYPDDSGVFASLMVPRDNSPTWEEPQLDGSHISKFSKVLDDIKKKLE
jgi:hypothetical protein